MYYLPYNKDLKEFSRQLRKNMTLGEVLLWNILKAGAIKGYTFNRQKPIENYIVDFYCKPLKLVIEVDGISHSFDDVKIKDEKKQEAIEKLGLNLLRLNEKDIRFHRTQVVDAIINKIEQMEMELGITPK
jgi:very-short-patch-repair endonuclease